MPKLLLHKSYPSPSPLPLDRTGVFYNLDIYQEHKVISQLNVIGEKSLRAVVCQVWQDINLAFEYYLILARIVRHLS